MKITKSKLAQIIKEELTKAQKDRKKELQDELEDLEHQRAKKVKLSSALMERYGISEEDAQGEVLWHSLNENAEISVYDVKFGNTVVRNLLAEDVTPVIIEEHKHFKRDDDDPERGNKK